jgi:Activator of Hsp90 ATPase homolog 1-like protein
MVDILHRVGIRSSVAQVYQAISSREGGAGWWTTNTTGEGKTGGVLRFAFSAGGVEIGSFEMKVLELQPSRRVMWEVMKGPVEWIGTKVSFDLRQSGEYSIVIFKHQGWKEPVEFMHHCSTKWAMYLMSLKAFVETGKGLPNPDDIHISGDGAD